MKQGISFENQVLQLVQSMGFIAETTKSSGDGGIDIIAHSKQPLMRGKYIIQCKDWSSPVGEPPLRDLYGVVHAERANKGILITTSTFTIHAIRFAEDKPLELIDGEEFNELLHQYGLESQESNAENNEANGYEGPNMIQEAFEKGLLQLTYVDTNDPECEFEDCLYEFCSVSINKDFKFTGQTKAFSFFDVYFIEKGQGNYDDNEDWIKYTTEDGTIHFSTLSTLQIKFEHTVLKTYYYELHFKGKNELVGNLWSGILLKSDRLNTNKQCFVATEVYGDNNSLPVQALRYWRDNSLMNHKLGRDFIAFYYRNGERFVVFLKPHPWLKKLIKYGLDKFIILLQMKR